MDFILTPADPERQRVLPETRPPVCTVGPAPGGATAPILPPGGPGTASGAALAVQGLLATAAPRPCRPT